MLFESISKHKYLVRSSIQAVLP